MRVVCISDTHGLHADLHAAARIPDGDVLVHAGDFTDTGDRAEVLAFNAFLATLPHKYKLVVAGNHESTFDRAFYPHNWQQYGHAQQYDPAEVRALLTNALYLEDQAVLVDGFLFYGSPWQPEFCNWAFNLPRGDKLTAKWRQIPSQVDVLVTHTPPLGRGDQVGHVRVGCADLLHEVQTRIRPTYHVFGHVHEGYGSSSDGVTTFLNASSCTHEYEAINPAFVIDLKAPRFVHSASDGGIPRYEVLLHEQLRVCSQKPPFVPVANAAVRPASHPHSLCHHSHDSATRKASLQEFRVDGTTQALLFESTLKLRPVRAQTRALRYLFHRGFHSALPASEDGNDESSTPSDAASNGAPAESNATALRRRVSLSRRATMGVIEEIPDATREAVASTSTITREAGDEATATGSEASAPRRARRNKTLTKRDAVAKLATMMEEPDDRDAVVEVALPPPPATIEAVEPPPVEPPAPAVVVAVDCILCKFQVAGHVHPGSAPAATPAAAAVVESPVQSPPKPAESECMLCKYKVAGHVHPGAEPPPTPPGESQADKSTDDSESTTRTNARALADRNSRLSSWF